MLAACSSDSESAAPASGATTGAAAVETALPTDISAVVADTVATAGSLEALLITSLPAEYAQIDDSEADTGPSDLAKAVSDDGGADAEAVLTGAGFVDGYQRSWQTEDQSSTIIVFLYQFSKADGAASYRDRTIDTFDSEATLKALAFKVDGIPDASGRSLTNLEADGRLASSVVFSKIGYMVQIVVVGPTDNANQILARQLALDQFNRL
jgi:hypothetical protein